MSRNVAIIRAGLLSTILLLSVYAAIATGGIAQETAPENARVADPNRPILLGEKIVFEILWKPPAWLFFIPSLHAGNITLEVKSMNVEPGNKTFRVSGEVLSSGSFSSLAGMKVTNRYESTLDAESLCSQLFVLKRREGKRAQDVELDFQREAGRLQIRKWDVSRKPPLELRSETVENIPPCVQDVLSIFYSVRKLPLEVGKSRPVFLSNDDGRTQEIQLLIEKEEAVKTDIGRFPTYKIQTLGLFGGLFRSGGEFKVWLDKATKIPVKFEAKVKFGRVFGRITRHEPGRSPVRF